MTRIKTKDRPVAAIVSQFNPKTEALLARYETLMGSIDVATEHGSHRDVLLLTLERDQLHRAISNLFERGEL